MAHVPNCWCIGWHVVVDDLVLLVSTECACCCPLHVHVLAQQRSPTIRFAQATRAETQSLEFTYRSYVPFPHIQRSFSAAVFRLPMAAAGAWMSKFSGLTQS